MPHHTSLIALLCVGFVLAFALGLLAQRLRLSPLVGYLLAGVLAGPFTPGFVADQALAPQVAEIGVILLMFGVGLHFSLRDLMAVRAIAVPGAIAQIAVATLMGWGLARWLGWSHGAGLMFGLALSVASTVVLLRALEERRLVESEKGRIAVGWLIVEDLAMVLALVLVPALAGALSGEAADGGAGVVATLGLTLLKVAAFVAVMLLVGRRVVPWVLERVAGTGSRELFTLCVLALAMGIAFGAAELFGVSFALGAFFAGMLLNESEFGHKAADESLPLRDAFAVLFFVSVGMLFDPQVLIEHPLEVLATFLIIVLGKSLAAWAIVRAFGKPNAVALTISASLAQIGEFSFILVGLGASLGLLPPEGASLVLAGALISIAVNPVLFRAIAPLQEWLRAKSAWARSLEQRDDPLAELPMSTDQRYLARQVVLVGYGRVGQRIASALAARDIPFVVAEQNRDLVEMLREQGLAAVYGDAVEPSVLIQAHIARAHMLVIATPDTLNVRQIVETARTLNPGIATVVRSHNEEEARLLEQDGVGKVFLGEEALAVAMTDHVLDCADQRHAQATAPGGLHEHRA